MRKAALALLAVVAAGCGGGAHRAAVGGLPAHGIVVENRGDIVLLDLRGHVLRRLAGYRLDEGAMQPPDRQDVLVRDRRGREYTITGSALTATRRPAPFHWKRPSGCAAAGASYEICGSVFSERPRASTVRLRGRVVVGPAHPSYKGNPTGDWEHVWLSPDGKTLLLQWSGECETPSAWFASANGGQLRPVAGNAADESVALGWTNAGRAVVVFPRAACGYGIVRAGIYLVEPSNDRKTFVTPRVGDAEAMW